MLALFAAVVLAHGAPPQTLQIIETPGSGATKLVGATFGALLSTDDACSWRWVCDASVGYGKDERPVWYLSSSGTLFAATYSGLFRSTDQGCSWSKTEATATTGASDITGDGPTLFAVSGKFGELNGAFRSTDDGATFTRLSLASATEYFSAVRLWGHRVYVSSWYFEPRAMALSVSDDSGDSFARIELTSSLPGTVQGPFTVHAIDPAASDTLYASVFDDVATPQTSHVLRSTNAGKTWVELFAAPGRVAQVTLSDDTVWVAVGHSVFRATGSGPFSALARPMFNACVARVAGRTLACGSVPFDGFAITDLTDGGTWLDWSHLVGPQRCAAGTAGALKCVSAWPVEANELGIDDAGVPACVAGPPAKPPACGCDGTGGALGLVGLFSVLFRRRAPVALESDDSHEVGQRRVHR